MTNRRPLLLTMLGVLAGCGGNAAEREHAAAPDSTAVRVTPAADGRVEPMVRIEIRTGDAVDSAMLPSDALPPIADAALIAGLVRWDGVAAPFAAYSNGAWVRVDRREFEQRIAHAPVSRWYYFAPRGPKRIVAADAIVTGLECGMYESWGQALHLDPSALPWRELFDSEEEREWAGHSCPLSRIGLALSEDVPLVRMVDVDTTGAQASHLLERVRSLFDEKETERIGHMRPDPADAARHLTGHPRAAAQRVRVPIRISALETLEHGIDGMRVTRFVATRSYPSLPRNGHECALETSLEGFVVGRERPHADDHRDEKLVFVGNSVGLRGLCSDAPGMQGMSSEPYGALRLDGRWFLLGLQHDYESSMPVIHEIAETGLTEVFLGWEQ